MGDTVGRLLSEEDRAYLAGLIDGDGSVMATIERHPEKRFGFRTRIILKVTQRRKEHVEWLIPLTGIGNIRANRDAYDWITRNQNAIRAILKQIEPYARIKKQQVKIALQILEQTVFSAEDMHVVATLSDALALHNVRSPHRRKNFSALLQKSSP